MDKELTFFEQQEILEKKAKRAFYKQFLDKPIIVVTNEIENLTVGIAKDIVFLTESKQPALVFYDVVRKKEEITFTETIFAFTQQKFNTNFFGTTGDLGSG